MIECVFTVDYEIYGNGHGSLDDLVLEPAEGLLAIFRKAGARMVFFVEVAEFESIEQAGTDPAIGAVRRQIRTLYEDGFEVGLHLHPQWCMAHHNGEGWHLDYGEYNLCVLPQSRIEEIVDQGITYLQGVVGVPGFVPLSFRAGNWLLQPTEAAANVLACRGIKLDSSVFKGGLQHQHGLDYRKSLDNGYFWRFQKDANSPSPEGCLLEVPIYSRMVPIWKMFTGKRVGLQQKGAAMGHQTQSDLGRLRDFLRLKQPLKLDFCRMTIKELTRMVDDIIAEDKDDPSTFRPLVAIGHTKDLKDMKTVEVFVDWLLASRVPISTFRDVYPKCLNSLKVDGYQMSVFEREGIC